MDIFGFDEGEQDRGSIFAALGITRSDTGVTMYVTPSTAELRVREHHREEEEVDPGLATTRPATKEAIVILCLVVIILLAAAKYVGCNLCPCFKKKKHRAHDQTYRPVRRDNVLNRPEYENTMAYATYSRPQSAIATVDARGYGYDNYDDEADAKVYAGKSIIDPPPQYNSLVPPTYATNYNYYTYSDNKRNIGDVVL